MLADYPTIGKRGRERGTRELVVAGLPFIVIYAVQREELVILSAAYIHEIPVIKRSYFPALPAILKEQSAAGRGLAGYRQVTNGEITPQGEHP